MADAPSPPWKLACPWCPFFIVVNARGGRGRDPGSGVQAAEMMERHAGRLHGRSWRETVAALDATCSRCGIPLRVLVGHHDGCCSDKQACAARVELLWKSGGATLLSPEGVTRIEPPP